MAEHVADGIWLALGEKLVLQRNVALNVVDARLAGVGDDGIIFRGGDGSRRVFDLASKEVLPNNRVSKPNMNI